MNALTVFLSTLFFVLLGLAYIKGYDFVKKHNRERLIQFYLAMAIIRMLLVTTVVAIYVILSSSHKNSVYFAAMFLGMYAVMMVTTLILKH